MHKSTAGVQKTACSDERRCLPSASFLRTLTASGTPEGLCRLSSGFEGGESIFSCHGDSRLNVRQAASPRCSQHRRSCGFLIGELANNQPIIVAERQVPTDEFASNTFEEFGNRFLTIFWSRQHALDRVRSVPTTRDVDWLASLLDTSIQSHAES